ncbi:MAG: hypothetical protein ACJAVY_002145 [Marinoscillum sp.]|jgi:hypothetical protein
MLLLQDIIKMKSSAFQFYKFSPMSILTTFWSGLKSLELKYFQIGFGFGLKDDSMWEVPIYKLLITWTL